MAAAAAAVDSDADDDDDDNADGKVDEDDRTSTCAEIADAPDCCAIGALMRAILLADGTTGLADSCDADVAAAIDGETDMAREGDKIPSDDADEAASVGRGPSAADDEDEAASVRRGPSAAEKKE